MSINLRILFLTPFVVLFFTISTLDSFANKSDDSGFMLLLIDKKNLTAKLKPLQDISGHMEFKHSYKVAIGKEPGDKVKQGDLKTPEGIYFTEDSIMMKAFNYDKYGDIAIPITFPNLFDQYEHKTGYGIWLHGSGNDSRIAKQHISEGCVVFKNEDIKRLKKWLLPNHSIVVIVDNEDSFYAGLKETETLNKSFDLWLKAWKNRDIKKYSDFYSSDFKYLGKKKASFINNKERIFKSYKKISIDIDHYNSIIHPKYAMTFSNLDFNGDNRYFSQGRKILYWVKSGDKWKIIREFFDSNKIQPLFFANSSKTQANTTF